MNIKVFRSVIVCEWVLVVAGIVLSDVMEASLPLQLQEYLELQYSKDLSPNVWMVLFFTPLYLAGYIVGSIGLFLLKPWAKWLYLAAIIDNYIATLLFAEPTVDHALTSYVYDMGAVLAGFIIGVAFFTDVLKKKAKHYSDHV